jgi:hypothetical protein
MEVAPLIEDVLKRQGVRASFFLANELTRTGGTSLDDEWAPWWEAMAEQGHVFASKVETFCNGQRRNFGRQYALSFQSARYRWRKLTVVRRDQEGYAAFGI